MNWIQRSTQKNAGARKKEPARRQQLIIINFIKVRSRWFYNQQEDLNQKSPRVKNRFVFNNLAVDNVGQTADNKNTGSMIFPSFLLASKTNKQLGDETQLLTGLFLHTVLWLLFSILLSSWNWCLLTMNSRREISSRFTNDICLVA